MHAAPDKEEDKSMKLTASTAGMLTAALLSTAAGSAWCQQSYPSKPIRFITPYPPGGSTTILARMIGQRLNEVWGQPVIVDNRPGGNTVIGTQALARSAPDGYTILLAANVHATLQFMQKLPYDTFKDFAAVSTTTSNELTLVVHTSVPVATLKEFIAYAKSKPGELNAGSAGSGGFTHLSIVLFNHMTGTKLQHIPYKGSGPLVTDLIGGQVQLAFNPINNTVPHVKSGRLKAIAISGKGRNPALPQTPTFTEAGLPGFDVGIWFGVLAPAGTPRVVVDKLNAEINKFLGLAETRERLVAQGMDPYISTPEETLARLKADAARFGEVIKASNIQLEQ